MRHPTMCLLSAAMFTACDSPADESLDSLDPSVSTPLTEDCLAEAMALTPGTGADDFIQLSDGGTVILYRGAQNGYHIEIAGEATHAAQNVSIHATVTAIDHPTPMVIAGAEDIPEEQYKALAAYDDAQCSGKFWGVNAVMDDLPPEVEDVDVACALEGQRVEIAITVRELGGIEWDSEYEPCSVTSTVVATVQLSEEARSFCE